MSSVSACPTEVARRIGVAGVVQGVGFRPFVHRLAIRHDLRGWVRNEAGDVQIQVQGTAEALDAFLLDVQTQAPPLAQIHALDAREAVLEDHDGFLIVESADQSDRRQPISPDVAVCRHCHDELHDPGNRRFHYPFITCTDCGPRFTVIESVPYDRERTSMGAFAQCPACLEEYRDPVDRRYHSETNSCPQCGPRIWIEGDECEVGRNGGRIDSDRVLARAASALLEGKILAIRGLGGFHLAVDATNEAAVRRLRDRKAREAKPFAVMVRDLDQAGTVGIVGAEEEALLGSLERPIVLLPRKPGSRLASSVSPGLDTVGVMVAYTPLHDLLLEEVGRPLVMTSGNRGGQPIATGNDEARRVLAGIADLFLLHDRDIIARCDDSVIRPTRVGPVFLRRARGYAPLPLKLPVPSPVPLLAVGPHLKNTFTLVHGQDAFVSQHIGDLETLETLEGFNASLEALRALFRVDPEVVVRDLHPGYLSTRMAGEMGLGEPLTVQHHHAHVAAVAAEHGIQDPVLGVAFDGTGYGPDGTVWGGEVLVADLTDYRRVAGLRPAPLPGGDLAVRCPWRAALGYASLESGGEEKLAAAFRPVPEAELEVARCQIRAGLNSPRASSMGRLFDAVAAILGLCSMSRYEGQAAMELEALAGKSRGIELPFPVAPGKRGGWVLEPVPLLVALADKYGQGGDPSGLAAGFHDAVAAATKTVITALAEEEGIRTVALGGGVFQNARLLETTTERLGETGLTVLSPRFLGPNDGAVSFGQAAVGAAVLHRRRG